MGRVRLAACLFLYVGMIPAHVAGEAPTVDELVRPLAQFESFFGAWGPDPDSDFVKADPARADMIAFLFEWGGADKKTVRFYEGIPGGDRSRRILECFVAADPNDGSIVFLGFQHQNGFLYRGRFEFVERGFVRLYDVSYAEEISKEPIGYRDRCQLIDDDTLECITEQRDGDGWKAWGTGKPFRMLRKTDGA